MTSKIMAYGFAILLGSAVPALSFAVDAVDTTAGTLDEIVVTAQKRVESIQDVPVSVTVVSSEELSRRACRPSQTCRG